MAKASSGQEHMNCRQHKYQVQVALMYKTGMNIVAHVRGVPLLEASRAQASQWGVINPKDLQAAAPCSGVQH